MVIGVLGLGLRTTLAHIHYVLRFTSPLPLVILRRVHVAWAVLLAEGHLLGEVGVFGEQLAAANFPLKVEEVGEDLAGKEGGWADRAAVQGDGYRLAIASVRRHQSFDYPGGNAWHVAEQHQDGFSCISERRDPGSQRGSHALG